jgi:hypothetical protein
VFGKNDELRTVMNTSTLVYDGVQLQIVEDIIRRVLLIEIDPGVEFPERTEFPFDPVKEAEQQRVEIVIAVGTLMRAFLAVSKHEQPQLKVFPNFEDWSLIRQVLAWGGEEDPLSSQDEIVRVDTRRMRLVRVIDEWAKVLGSKIVTAGELIAAARKRAGLMDDATPEAKAAAPFLHPELREALMEVAADEKGWMSAHKLGAWLRLNKNIPVEGLTIRMDEDKGRHVTVWYIEGGDDVPL